jgi:hypothetical protein
VVCQRDAVNVIVLSQCYGPLPEILYVGLRDRVDLRCVGKLEGFDETKYFLRLFAMFFKNPPHVFH